MTEPGFLDRVFRTGTVVWLLAFFIVWAKYGAGAASGWSAGAAFSFALFLILRKFVVQTFVPGNESAKTGFAIFMIVQVPVALLVLGSMVYVSKFIPGFILPFCAGVGLVQIIILLKATGVFLLEKMEK